MMSIFGIFLRSLLLLMNMNYLCMFHHCWIHEHRHISHLNLKLLFYPNTTHTYRSLSCILCIPPQNNNHKFPLCWVYDSTSYIDIYRFLKYYFSSPNTQYMFNLSFLNKFYSLELGNWYKTHCFLKPSLQGIYIFHQQYWLDNLYTKYTYFLQNMMYILLQHKGCSDLFHLLFSVDRGKYTPTHLNLFSCLTKHKLRFLP